MIGRVSRQKDPAHFARVAQIIRRTRPDIRFVWAGEGDATLTRVLLDAGVRVTGWLDRDSLIELLSEPAVYFHSAIYEGFPLSALDAAAFEHPIVVRAIRPFDGLGLVSTGSASEAADVILSVLDRDPAYDDAARGSRALIALMNRDSQASAMRSVVASLERSPVRDSDASDDQGTTVMIKGRSDS
jgi:glycosyltransferase involved in cell wall biosynthesis